jgi:hypothetical protein
MPGDKNRERVRLLFLAQLIAVLYYWLVISVFGSDLNIKLQIFFVSFLTIGLTPCIYLIYGDQRETRLYAREKKDNHNNHN